MPGNRDLTKPTFHKFGTSSLFEMSRMPQVCCTHCDWIPTQAPQHKWQQHKTFLKKHLQKLRVILADIKKGSVKRSAEQGNGDGPGPKPKAKVKAKSKSKGKWEPYGRLDNYQGAGEDGLYLGVEFLNW